MREGGGLHKTRRQGDDSHFQRDLEILIVQRDHDYCGVPVGQIERQCKLGFKKFLRLKQMATFSKSVPNNLCDLGILRVGFFLHQEYAIKYDLTCRGKKIHTA